MATCLLWGRPAKAATTCKEWCDAIARGRGDLLTEQEADDLALFRVPCGLLARGNGPEKGERK